MQYLLQHHLFEHLRERVAARIGLVRDGFGDRRRVGVEEVADRRVAADQDELARGRGFAEGLEQPEQAFDRDVHHIVGRLLAGGEVEDVGDIGHRRLGRGAIGKAAAHDVDPRRRFERSAMAEGAQAGGGETLVGEEPPNEMAAHLTRRPGDEQQHASSRRRANID